MTTHTHGFTSPLFLVPWEVGNEKQAIKCLYTACWHQPKLKFYSITAPLKGSRPYLYFFLYSDPTTWGFLLSFKHPHPHKFVSISACHTPCSFISPQIVLGLYTADSWSAKPTLIPKSFLPCLPPLQKRKPSPHLSYPALEYLRARSIGHDREAISHKQRLLGPFLPS